MIQLCHEVINLSSSYGFFSAHDADTTTKWAAFQQIGTPVRFSKGRIIYLQGQAPQYLYYLAQGQVKSFIVSDRGEERILTVYNRGSIFGEASFFDEQPRMSSAAALENCEIIPISQEQVLALFQQQPQLAVEMLRYLSQTVRLLSDQVDRITFLGADQRILRVLLSLPAKDQVVQTTQDDLASAVGASRITVCRFLNKLQAAGYLKTGYGCITLLNLSALHQMVEHE